MTELLKMAIASGQVSADQIESHRVAGELPITMIEPDGTTYTLMTAAQPAQINPAPGYCKNCKDYTIEEPLFAQPAALPVPLTGLPFVADFQFRVTALILAAWNEGNAYGKNEEGTENLQPLHDNLHAAKNSLLELVIAEPAAPSQPAALPVPRQEPLSQGEIMALWIQYEHLPAEQHLASFVRAVEAVHGIKVVR